MEHPHWRCGYRTGTSPLRVWMQNWHISTEGVDTELAHLKWRCRYRTGTSPLKVWIQNWYISTEGVDTELAHLHWRCGYRNCTSSLKVWIQNWHISTEGVDAELAYLHWRYGYKIGTSPLKVWIQKCHIPTERCVHWFYATNLIYTIMSYSLLWVVIVNLIQYNGLHSFYGMSYVNHWAMVTVKCWVKIKALFRSFNLCLSL